MPFDEDFTDIYTDIIKPALEKHQFRVDRADDIESQQNILRDIIERIHSSDLIIADLTSNNPNVFYELGLAHAFKKPVILLTQSTEDVPFDLKSYRILEYSRDFKEIDKAKTMLTKYAEGFRNETVRFGNPVTDFFRNANVPAPIVAGISADGTNASVESEEDERGYIDHLIDINESYTKLGSLMERVTEDLIDMSQFMENKTNELGQITSNTSSSTPVAARGVLRQLAGRIGSFSSALKQANAEYGDVAQTTEDSLEFVVSFHREESEATKAEVEEQMQSLRSLRSSATGGRDSLLDLARIMDDLPRMERRLNREVAKGSEEIRVMASNIDKTAASISRAIQEP